jgi:hypothetical protein
LSAKDAAEKALQRMRYSGREFSAARWRDFTQRLSSWGSEHRRLKVFTLIPPTRQRGFMKRHGISYFMSIGKFRTKRWKGAESSLPPPKAMKTLQNGFILMSTNINGEFVKARTNHESCQQTFLSGWTMKSPQAAKNADFFKNNNRTRIDLLLMKCTKIQTANSC